MEPFGNIWDILGQIWDTRQPAQAFKQQHRTPDNRGLNTNELKQFSAEVLHLDIYGTYMGHIWDIYGTYRAYVWHIYGIYMGQKNYTCTHTHTQTHVYI